MVNRANFYFRKTAPGTQSAPREVSRTRPFCGLEACDDDLDDDGDKRHSADSGNDAVYLSGIPCPSSLSRGSTGLRKGTARATTSATMVPIMFFCLHFNKNAELTMTSTEPALCTSAPTTGSSAPVIASTMAVKVERHGEGHVQADGAHHALWPGAKRCGISRMSFVDLRAIVGGVHGDVAAHAAHGHAHVGRA